MKYLLDTNVIVPLEPGSPLDLEVNTDLALQFFRLASNSKQELFVHPAIERDLERDKNLPRAELRRTLLKRYNLLVRPPAVSPKAATLIGTSLPQTNDWVDDQLLACVEGNAVDYLVTEDTGIHRKSGKLGLQSRVLRLAEAVSILKDLFETQPRVPPAVEQIQAYELDASDPIFDSLRDDYPGFDEWFAKCKREHRSAYVIKEHGTGGLAGVCILKPETSDVFGLKGKILKVCTFKISDAHNGNRFGELLLKPIFDFLYENRYDFAFLTVFEKHAALIDLLHTFGFDDLEKTTNTGELVLVKRVKHTPQDAAELSSLEFNRRYGPWVTKFGKNSTFIVPVQPLFHSSLFPEFETQQVLNFGLSACGNSIRKAYLSNSAISTVSPGDNVLFYRSGDQQAATVLGLVEGTLRSESPNAIAQFVGKRTVYSFLQIEEMCRRSPVLAFKFRRVCFLQPPIPLSELIHHECVAAAPQSIQSLKRKGTEWLARKLRM